MYECLKNWSSDSPRLLGELCRRHLVLFMELGRVESATGPWLKWRWSPKHHMMQHLCEQQTVTHGNPSVTWNYRDEAEISLAVKLAESCHVSTIPTATMDKYLLWTALFGEE